MDNTNFLSSSYKKTKIKVDLDKERAEIEYTTNKGKVKFTFYQEQGETLRDCESNSWCNLVVDIEAKSKLGCRYKDITSACEQVYSEEVYAKSNTVHSNGGHKVFSENIETAKIKHENQEITKIIQQAQKDIAEHITVEKQRLRQLKEKEKNNERQKIAEKRKKENAFIQKFFNSLQRK